MNNIIVIYMAATICIMKIVDVCMCVMMRSEAWLLLTSHDHMHSSFSSLIHQATIMY